ncbi:collagen, type I, alpha 1a-like [Haliaeetus albicilla]|uniref:collagen, type I, alpha 1a-like n=1 Tax=Haliaeetus albicilla TaxID=8969 RepID=UPI0037E869F6
MAAVSLPPARPWGAAGGGGHGGDRGALAAAAGGDGCRLCAGRHPRAALLPPEPPGGDELQLGGPPAPPRSPRPVLPEPQDARVGGCRDGAGTGGAAVGAGATGGADGGGRLRRVGAGAGGAAGDGPPQPLPRPHRCLKPTWSPRGSSSRPGRWSRGGPTRCRGAAQGRGVSGATGAPPRPSPCPPTEPLDVWRQEEESGGGQRGLILLWKDPSAGGGREYTVTVERDRGLPRRLHPPCCRCPLPPDTVSVAVTARGPPGPSAPARLRLDRTDLPPPRGVRVKPVPGPGLGVWWEPGGPPAAPQYLVEWAEVGAGGASTGSVAPPGPTAPSCQVPLGAACPRPPAQPRRPYPGPPRAGGATLSSP